MNNDQYEFLEKVHKSNLRILKDVDRVCKKHHIQYFLHGGSFLGALRHKDFIPWDDDVDITMKRADYERFLEVYPSEKTSKMKLLRFEDYPQFFDFISKVVDESVTYENTVYGDEDYYEGRYSHPTLDIFVLDEIGTNHKAQLMKLKLIYALAMGHRKDIDFSKFKGIMFIASHVLSFVGSKMSFWSIAQMYKKAQILGDSEEFLEFKESDFEQSKELEIEEIHREPMTNDLFLSNEQPDPRYWGLIYDKEMYYRGHNELIRDEKYPAPYESDKWMKMVYGDYMTLPEESKRVPQHVRKIV